MRALTHITTVAVLLAALPHAVVGTGDESSPKFEEPPYFPLATGNVWNYTERRSGGTLTASVNGRDGEEVDYRFGPSNFRLRDRVTEIDIELEGSFVPYYRFGQSSWTHRDRHECDDGRTMEVLDRDATVETPAGVFHNCIDIGYSSENCLDAGTVREWWTPGVGRVKWVEVTIAGWETWELESFEPGDDIIFRRADPNGDEKSDLSDAMFTLNFLFLGAAAPECMKSTDVNDSGVVDIADPVYLLAHLFLGGLPPAPPAGACGHDETPDDLTCDAYGACVVFPVHE